MNGEDDGNGDLRVAGGADIDRGACASNRGTCRPGQATCRAMGRQWSQSDGVGRDHRVRGLPWAAALRYHLAAS